MKKTFSIVLSSIAMLMMASAAFAQESAKQGDGAWAIFLGAGLAIGLAAAGTGIGMGRAIDAALTGISRNPSVAPRIMTMMVLGLALIESLAIYALVVAILLLFVI